MPRLTPEQKKSVPHKLRGAGKYRQICKYCGLVHVTPPSYCEHNPNAEKNRKKVSMAVKEAISKPEHREALKRGSAAWWSKPGSREKHREGNRKAGLKSRRTGRFRGHRNNHYGHHHTLQNRLAQSRRSIEMHRRRALKAVREEEFIPMSNPMNFPRPTGFSDMDAQGWIPSDSNPFIEDEFDPFR